MLREGSLRSKRFQSCYCAKVRAEAKKRFFCSCPSFLDEPREETLATQAIEKVDCMLFLVQVVNVAVSYWIIKLLPLSSLYRRH